MLITHFTRWLITTVLLFAPRGTISSETLLIITAYHILSLGMNYMYEVLPDLNWTDCSDFWNVSPFQSAVLMVEDNYVYVMRSICKAKKPSCWKLQEILTVLLCLLHRWSCRSLRKLCLQGGNWRFRFLHLLSLILNPCQDTLWLSRHSSINTTMSRKYLEKQTWKV